jgi:hypothetical protein
MQTGKPTFCLQQDKNNQLEDRHFVSVSKGTSRANSKQKYKSRKISLLKKMKNVIINSSHQETRISIIFI